MNKKIRIFDLKYEKNFLKEFYIHSKKILKKGFLTNDEYVIKLEKLFSLKNNSKYSVAVNSGTSALELILRSVEITNKEVIVSNNTFIATAVSIKSAGGIPIPVDLDNSFFGPSLDSIKKKITKKTKVVVLVHISGLINKNILEIKKFCNEKNIFLVEDCAQAYGSSAYNTQAGNFGIAAAFSFFTTKVVASGEGGIIVTKSYSLYKKLIRNRQFGYLKSNNLIHSSNGSNFKLSELNALLAYLDLNRSHSRILKRNKIASIYQKKLNPKKYLCLKQNDNSFSNYYKQIIIPLSNTRKTIQEKLNKNNIPLTGGVYNKPLNRQPILGLIPNNKFPNSSYFSDYHFCPPCYPELSLTQVERICKVLNSL